MHPELPPEPPSPSPQLVQARVSGLLMMQRAIVRDQGPRSLAFGPTHGPYAAPRPSQAGTGASLRAVRPLDRLDVWALQSRGVVFQRLDAQGQPAPLGLVYSVWVPWASLDALAAWPSVARVEPSWSPLTLRPLEVTSALTGAAQAHQLPEVGVTGRGALIADIDSGIDVLHPAFFRADGPRFEWIDADQNGRFDAGIDAIDLNRDGQAQPYERARVFAGTTVLDYAGPVLEGHRSPLDARRDWLYVDANNDFRRNAGPHEGFTEDDPAYGEPLFVVEDADDDGQLSPGERVVQLKTSKIVAYVQGQRAYTRGQDLIQAAAPNPLIDPFHGTGVAGIAVGGQLGYHTRVGLAPDAELLMLSRSPEDAQGGWSHDPELALVQEAVERGAHVLLHEWTNPYVRPLDGSTNLEAAMDAALARGVIQVNPLGNLNRAGKHVERDMKPDEPLTLSFEVGPGFESAGQLAPYSILYSSLQWLGLQQPRVTLQAPGGQSIEVPTDPDQSGVLVDGFVVSAVYDTTPRQNTMLALFIYSADQRSALPQGRWSVRLDGAQTPTRVVGRISDHYSGWSPGVGWVEPTPDVRSLSFPSTADSALGVAAFGGRHALADEGSQPGQLRGYSGRGPRLDGRRSVHLAAPDDPYAPLPGSPQLLQAGFGASWFAPFGGTSGAAPHVAAALALLRQRWPQEPPQGLVERLLESADREALGEVAADSLPDDRWGHGKLDVYHALYGERAPQNQPPRASLRVTLQDQEVTLDASLSQDPDQEPLEFRFDVEHDGEFDGPWSQQATRREPLARWEQQRPQGPWFVRVQVRDARGATRSALAQLERLEPGPLKPDAPGFKPKRDAREPQEDEGCGCAAGGHGAGAPGAPGRAAGRATPSLALLALGMAWRARRRRTRDDRRPTP